MIFKATLKKLWISPRGRLYSPGTIFTFSKRLIDINSAIYNFTTPGQGHGFVVLPDIIFKQLTEEEKYVRVLRKKLREEHIKKTTELFNI